MAPRRTTRAIDARAVLPVRHEDYVTELAPVPAPAREEAKAR